MNGIDTVIIAGHGRSGSNRLLDVFAASARTNCRNEPNEIEGSALAALPDGFFLFESNEQAAFLEAWGPARDFAARSIGERDRIAEGPKDWRSELARSTIGKHVLRRRRVRGALSPLNAEWAEGEWQADRFYASGAIDDALPVFKILLMQGWADALLRAETGTLVVHNLRDPDDFLRSWWHRYVAEVGTETVYADSARTLDRVVAAFGGARLYSEEGSAEATMEAELWRWRYVNEPLYVRHRDHPRYALVTYAEASRDPLGVAERLYALAGLELDEGARQRIGGMTNALFAPRRDALPVSDGALEAMKAHVLADSPLRAVLPAAS